MICHTASITRPISGLSDAKSDAPSCSVASSRSNGAHTVGELSAWLGEVLAARVGEPERTPAPLVVALDQALVLELRDRRVDRAGARPPGAVGALGDLLDHLVAVQRLRRRAPRGSRRARRRGVRAGRAAARPARPGRTARPPTAAGPGGRARPAAEVAPRAPRPPPRRWRRAGSSCRAHCLLNLGVPSRNSFSRTVQSVCVYRVLYRDISLLYAERSARATGRPVSRDP